MDIPLDLSAYSLGCVRSHAEFGTQNYASNQDCTWIFEMTATEKLSIEFVQDSAVESSTDCVNDYISLNAGPKPDSSVLEEKVCGGYDRCL